MAAFWEFIRSAFTPRKNKNGECEEESGGPVPMLNFESMGGLIEAMVPNGLNTPSHSRPDSRMSIEGFRPDVDGSPLAYYEEEDPEYVDDSRIEPFSVADEADESLIQRITVSDPLKHMDHLVREDRDINEIEERYDREMLAEQGQSVSTTPLPSSPELLCDKEENYLIDSKEEEEDDFEKLMNETVIGVLNGTTRNVPLLISEAEGMGTMDVNKDAVWEAILGNSDEPDYAEDDMFDGMRDEGNREGEEKQRNEVVEGKSDEEIVAELLAAFSAAGVRERIEKREKEDEEKKKREITEKEDMGKKEEKMRGGRFPQHRCVQLLKEEYIQSSDDFSHLSPVTQRIMQTKSISPPSYVPSPSTISPKMEEYRTPEASPSSTSHVHHSDYLCGRPPPKNFIHGVLSNEYYKLVYDVDLEMYEEGTVDY